MNEAPGGASGVWGLTKLADENFRLRKRQKFWGRISPTRELVAFGVGVGDYSMAFGGDVTRYLGRGPISLSPSPNIIPHGTQNQCSPTNPYQVHRIDHIF